MSNNNNRKLQEVEVLTIYHAASKEAAKSLVPGFGNTGFDDHEYCCEYHFYLFLASPLSSLFLSSLLLPYSLRSLLCSIFFWLCRRTSKCAYLIKNVRLLNYWKDIALFILDLIMEQTMKDTAASLLSR